MAAAGKFRERAVFEREGSGALDRFGNGAGAGWAALLTVWADLRETPGRERLAAGRLEAPATGTLRVRSSAAARAITAADRVVIRGATWNIVGGPIDPTGRGRVLEFTLERGGAVQ